MFSIRDTTVEMKLLYSFLLFSSIIYWCSADLAVHSVEIKRDDFDSHVTAKSVLVAFHSNNCEASKRFLARFDKLAESLNVREDIVLGHVDCDSDKEFCESKGAERLGVFLYPKDEERIKYTGVKTEEGLSKFLVKKFGDVITEHLLEIPQALTALNDLTEETLADHVAVGNHFVKFYAPWCGHCKKLEPVWEELANSLEYDPSVSISRIDCTQHRPVCQEYDVKGYPSLLWIVDGKKESKYSGARTLEEFKKFIEEKTGAQGDAKDKESSENAIGVLELSEDSFEHTIEKGATIVKFFAPWCGHCKRMAPTWDDLAQKYIGNPSVKVAKVDCTKTQGLCGEKGVDGYPTIFLYIDGQRVEEYDGDRTLGNLVQFINDHVNKRDEL